MLPSAAPGRIGLVGDSVGYGRTPFDELVDVARDAQPVALRSEVAGHHAERSPDLPLDVDVPRLHRVRSGSPESTEFGARPAASAVVAPLSSRMLPAKVSGVASGGLDDGRATRRWSPACRPSRAYAPRTTVRPSCARRPDDADARLEIVPFSSPGRDRCGADLHQRIASAASNTTNRSSAVGRRHDAVVAQPEIELDARAERERVLRRTVPSGLLHDVRRAVAEGDVERVADACLERRDGSETGTCPGPR